MGNRPSILGGFKWLGTCVCVLLFIAWYLTRWVRSPGGGPAQWEGCTSWWFWFVFALIIAATALLWHRDYRSVPPGRCATCGYDLTGNLSGACPECGVPIAESIRRATERVPWRAADYTIFAVLLACAVSLLWRVSAYGRLYFGHTVYRPFALLGALCYGYLCLRFRPFGATPGQRLSHMLPLLVVLVLLWAVLMVADDLEHEWYIRSGGSPY